MNMDQVLVLTYTDRNQKTRVIPEYEFFELFVCENNHGKILNDEEEWLEIFGGDFNYISFYQAVINGDLCSFYEISAQLNRHWSDGDSNESQNGVFGFVNAGVLDHKLFGKSTFETKEPTDFEIWMFARKNNYDPMLPMNRPGVSLPKDPIVTIKSPTRKVWLL